MRAVLLPNGVSVQLWLELSLSTIPPDSCADIAHMIPSAFALRLPDGTLRPAAGFEAEGASAGPPPLFVALPEAAFRSGASSSLVRAQAAATPP